MNIAIIGFAKIKYMPYLNFYLENIDIKKHNVSVFYWTRDSKEDSSLPKEISVFAFKYQQEDHVSKYKKIYGFLSFRKAAKKFLINGKFDKVIVLTTYPALLLSNFLLKYYKRQYIFDYRDLTLENIALFKSQIGKIVNEAEATFVSSRGFLKYLPDTRIYITHNLSSEFLSSSLNKSIRIEQPLRIRYWGLFRDLAFNMKFIEHICNDTRFELHYHGREQNLTIELRNYCNQIGAKNIFFHGEYVPAEKKVFSNETDIIHNAYDSKDIGAAYAISNKYYDGLVFKLPQLCGSNTFMGKCAVNNGIGIMVDPENSSFADNIYNYYCNINWEKFYNDCESTLTYIEKEYESAKNYLRCL